jgi:hypothetical protein
MFRNSFGNSFITTVMACQIGLTPNENIPKTLKGAKKFIKNI